MGQEICEEWNLVEIMRLKSPLCTDIYVCEHITLYSFEQYRYVAGRRD